MSRRMSDDGGHPATVIGRVTDLLRWSGTLGTLAYGARCAWRLSADDGLTLADWRILAGRTAMCVGLAGFLAASGWRPRGRPLLSLAASMIPAVLAFEPSLVLDHDVDALARVLEPTRTAFHEEADRMAAFREGDAGLRCAALDRYAAAMRDRVYAPGSPPPTDCAARRGDVTSVPAPFDRLGHVRDVFVGGGMRVLPPPVPPDLSPAYRA